MQPGPLIRDARRQAGLTQAQLAAHVGTTQSGIARLERAASNPSVETLRRTLIATGHHLDLVIRPSTPSIDLSLVRQHLQLTPGRRIEELEAMYVEASEIAAAGARARGEAG